MIAKTVEEIDYYYYDGADDSDVTEPKEDSGSVFTAVEAYDSSCAEDIGPYWNTLECTPYYEPIE